MRIAEIVGPDEKVHYRRPEGHPDIDEAEATPGYWVRYYDECGKCGANYYPTCTVCGGLKYIYF
jgi:hypothetical protein